MGADIDTGTDLGIDIDMGGFRVLYYRLRASYRRLEDHINISILPSGSKGFQKPWCVESLCLLNSCLITSWVLGASDGIWGLPSQP